MIWRRGFMLSLVFLTGLLLQTTVLGTRTLGGTQPELVLLIVIALGISEGPMSGALAGFGAGLATDLLLTLPTGLSAFVFTTIGYGVGALREHYVGATAWLPIVVAGLATAAGVLAYGALATLFGTRGIVALDMLRHAGLSAAYGMLLAPFVLPVMRRLAGRLRTQKVVRL